MAEQEKLQQMMPKIQVIKKPEGKVIIMQKKDGHSVYFTYLCSIMSQYTVLVLEHTLNYILRKILSRI